MYLTDAILNENLHPSLSVRMHITDTNAFFLYGMREVKFEPNCS